MADLQPEKNMLCWHSRENNKNMHAIRQQKCLYAGIPTYRRVKPGVDPISISDGMLDQLGLGANVNFVFASNMMSDTSAKLQRITGGLYGAAAGFWCVAAIVMFIVFFFAFNERQKEFATLRALGAPKSKVISLVLTESTLMSLIGSVFGIGFGALASASAAL